MLSKVEVANFLEQKPGGIVEAFGEFIAPGSVPKVRPAQGRGCDDRAGIYRGESGTCGQQRLSIFLFLWLFDCLTMFELSKD